jgi:hypothetical protein
MLAVVRTRAQRLRPLLGACASPPTPRSGGRSRPAAASTGRSPSSCSSTPTTVHEYVGVRGGGEGSVRRRRAARSPTRPARYSTSFMPVHSASPDFPVWAKNRYDAALRSVDAAFGAVSLDGLDGRRRCPAIRESSSRPITARRSATGFVEGACFSLRRPRDSVSLRGGVCACVRGPRALDAEGARRGSR